MDFRRNVVLKEDATFFVADEHGRADGGEHGLFDRDTRFLSRYAWTFLDGDGQALQTLLSETPRPDTYHAHHALFEVEAQRLAVRRTMHMHAGGFHDDLVIENTSLDRRAIELSLRTGGDFLDLFEVRGWGSGREAIRTPVVRAHANATSIAYAHDADVGEQRVVLQFDAAAETSASGATWRKELAPGERAMVRVTCVIHDPGVPARHEAERYSAWRASFAAVLAGPEPRVTARAIDDLRGLLLYTEDGPVPAAGIPWYVAAFGRDALLTAHMLLPHRPDVAEATLRYLARYQGRAEDASSGEQPGKILHEIRFGPLTRAGRVPFGPYYGTVDATALFLMLLAEHRRATNDPTLAHDLRPAWEAALRWLVEAGDVDGDGFVEYLPQDGGDWLQVQSWKDSRDSMSHADGTLARGAIAVSEVQGYAYAAFHAAAAAYRELGETDEAAHWAERASVLARRFHEAYWLDDLGTYAMALDGDKRPLAVVSSDAGQLLWTGIVPRSHAPPLVKTLFSPESWSGWGIRTLGANEVRYNPVSYHNGSVWPHDNALIAEGLLHYGFEREARRIRDAVLDLAAAEHDRRLPELVAGYPAPAHMLPPPKHQRRLPKRPSPARPSPTSAPGPQATARAGDPTKVPQSRTRWRAAPKRGTPPPSCDC
ncbi:MAG: glycogen debranching N-terminal domain-containing protein [Trueperaceae bacterium]